MTENEIIFFKHEEFGEIRTLNIGGEPWFVGKDVATILGYKDSMRVVNADLEYMITGPRKEFISMAFLVIGNIPLLYMLNKAWFNSLMNTVVGQIVLAISAVGIFISTAIVIKLTKPIEYKR